MRPAQGISSIRANYFLDFVLLTEYTLLIIGFSYPVVGA